MLQFVRLEVRKEKHSFLFLPSLSSVASQLHFICQICKLSCNNFDQQQMPILINSLNNFNCFPPADPCYQLGRDGKEKNRRSRRSQTPSPEKDVKITQLQRPNSGNEIRLIQM